MSPRRHRGCTSDGESGMALVTVVLTTLVLMTVATAAVGYGLGSQNLSRRDQDWNAALAAAEAGIDDYVLRLNQDNNYWQSSDPDDPPFDTLNGALTGWVEIPGGSEEAEFHYEIDGSDVLSSGTVNIVSTGRLRNVERTIEATLRKRSFLDYLYFTDFETLDPVAYTGSPSPAWAQANCSRYWYNGRPEGSGQCVNIRFGGNDVINGPLHSNDAILIRDDPQFLGDTSTSWNDPGGKFWRDDNPVSTPFFANPGDPSFAPPLTMPPSNTALRAEADVDQGGQGCLFTGPTSIEMNADGTMTVLSPFSDDTSQNCWTSDLDTGDTMPLPANGVVFIENVPTGHAHAGCSSHPLGYPQDDDEYNSYSCKSGDAFVQGTLDGQLTIAAENDVTIVWHTTYEDGVAGDDLLGLVANNFVEVYHPIEGYWIYGGGNPSNSHRYCSYQGSNWWYCWDNVDVVTNQGTPLESDKNDPFEDARVDAAILSVQHSFLVQEWARPYSKGLGDLNVTGVIAQRFRGPVGTTSGSGYDKEYVYDTRLQYLQPPKFLDPVAASWSVATWAEVSEPAQ